MAQPNEPLRDVLRRFEADPNTNADQAAQLRATIASDAALLSRLNRDAVAGHLKNFALQAAGGSPNLAGLCDLSTGTVNLPASSFQPTGTLASPDLAATLRIQDMLLRFGHEHYKDASGNGQVVSQDMVDNLQGAINASPVLAQQLKEAATARPRPHLENFAILPPERGAGGTYDGWTKTMNLPAPHLQTKTAANPGAEFNGDNITFVVGHEVQHGFNHAEKFAALQTFDREVRSIARDNDPINDYTAPIRNRIQAARKDEAEAQIAGWNALASKHQQAGMTLQGMYRLGSGRVADFVDYDSATRQVSAKAGLTFNADLSLSQTPDNVAAMGRHYFDKWPKGSPGVPPAQTTSLGVHKEADNINYYGNGAISRAITIDRAHAHAVNGIAPQMRINMAQLRLDERLIERLGLEITPRPEQRQPYYDTSQTPPTLRHFDHTRTGPGLNQHIPIDPAILAPDPTVAQATKLPPSEAGHPDHMLYSQIAGHIREHDRQHGRSWDQASERMTASLLGLAKESGLTRVDHVVFSTNHDWVAAGENVFVVQGRLDDPAHLRAHMKTDEAARTPEAVSFGKVEQVNERIVQQTAQAQQMGQDEPARGPVMGGR